MGVAEVVCDDVKCSEEGVHIDYEESVMVLMVMGVPPFSMVGRHETATLGALRCAYRWK